MAMAWSEKSSKSRAGRTVYPNRAFCDSFFVCPLRFIRYSFPNASDPTAATSPIADSGSRLKPRPLPVPRQYQRHAVTVAAGVVDLAHQRVGGQRHDRAGQNLRAVARPRGLPQSAECEIVLPAKPYVPGLLDLAAGPCLPLVKPAGVYQASLFALPGVAIRRLARHLLGARIGGAVLGHFAPRPHRYEGPDGVFADELAARAGRRSARG